MDINWNEYYFPNEVMEQADAIENCMQALKSEILKISQSVKDISKVYIVGSGDCYFIGYAAAYAFQKLAGVEAAAYEAYDFYTIKPKVDKNTAVILFSSSGKSLYVQKSLEYANNSNGITVGVTNHADSPLGIECTHPLVTIATGVSKSFPTKTSTSGLALMYAFAGSLGEIKGVLSKEEAERLRSELSIKLPATIRKIYNEEYDKIKQNAKKFVEMRCYSFVGSGPSRSASMIGAAKIIETNRCQVMTTNAEEYMHLNGFAIKSSDAVIIIGNNISDHREKQVLEYAKAQYARVLVVGNVECEEEENVVRVAPFISELSEITCVIANMVALQLFACELSRISFKDPDAPHDVNLKHVINLLYTGPVTGWDVEGI